MKLEEKLKSIRNGIVREIKRILLKNENMIKELESLPKTEYNRTVFLDLVERHEWDNRNQSPRYHYNLSQEYGKRSGIDCVYEVLFSVLENEKQLNILHHNMGLDIQNTFRDKNKAIDTEELYLF